MKQTVQQLFLNSIPLSFFYPLKRIQNYCVCFLSVWVGDKKNMDAATEGKLNVKDVSHCKVFHLYVHKNLSRHSCDNFLVPFFCCFIVVVWVAVIFMAFKQVCFVKFVLNVIILRMMSGLCIKHFKREETKTSRAKKVLKLFKFI